MVGYLQRIDRAPPSEHLGKTYGSEPVDGLSHAFRRLKNLSNTQLYGQHMKGINERFEQQICIA